MKCVIFANGDFSISPVAGSPWQQAELVIACDGGGRHCQLLGIAPQLVIGDMDSIAPSLLAEFEKQGSEIHRVPARKDKTDLELAIELAVDRGAQDILIFGALGGRWDMSIAAIMLLAAPAWAGLSLILRDGATSIHRLRGGGHLTIPGAAGDTLSLIPLAGPVRGVTLNGLDYPLTGEAIEAGSSRGISNVFLGNRAEIALEEGLLLCIHSREEQVERRCAGCED